MSVFHELKRRKVLPSAVAYVVFGWLVIQVAAALASIQVIDPSLAQWSAWLVVAGFPIAVALAWFFDLSLHGIHLTGSGNPDQATAQTLVPPPVAVDRPAALKHSIAVLPFVDMSAERDQAYLGEGVAEEILNALVRVTPLRVSGRTSSFSFQSRDMTVSEIGAALRVAHVLEGSVRKHGDRVRITAQLIQVSDGFHLWSETYDGSLSDVFDLQDSIARSVVGELEIVLDVDQVRLVASMTKSPEAYDAFLQGRALAQVQDGAGVLARAVEHLQEAVNLDPQFALAWAWLANAHFFLPEHNDVADWQAHLEAGKRAAREAYRLDPDLSDANLAMSYAHLLELDIPAQWEARKRARDLDPSSVAAMHEFGMAFGLMGLVEKAYPYMVKSIADDPFSPSFTGALGVYEWAHGDPEAASASFDRSAELGFPLVVLTKGGMLTELGQPRLAREYMLSALKSHRDQLPASLKPRAVQRLICLWITTRAAWAGWLIWLGMKGRVGSSKHMSDLSFKATLVTLGKVEAYFDEVRNKPNPYLSGALLLLWLPSENARRMRTHPGFPRFAEDIGLVRAWQAHGWPPQIAPLPGTDGSNLQFTCN